MLVAQNAYSVAQPVAQSLSGNGSRTRAHIRADCSHISRSGLPARTPIRAMGHDKIQQLLAKGLALLR
jgi:hypothetical protein